MRRRLDTVEEIARDHERVARDCERLTKVGRNHESRLMRIEQILKLKALSFALCSYLIAPLALAEDRPAADLRRQAAAYAAATQPTPTVEYRRRSPSLFWGGIATSAAGSGLIIWTATQPSRGSLCLFTRTTGLICATSGINKTPWYIGAAALAGGGVVMSIIGDQRVRVEASPHRLQVAVALR